MVVSGATGGATLYSALPVAGFRPNANINMAATVVIKINGMETIIHDMGVRPFIQSMLSVNVKRMPINASTNAVLYIPRYRLITTCDVA